MELSEYKIPTVVFGTPEEASRFAAGTIEQLVRTNNEAGRTTVLGLATGSTPVGLYQDLSRRHREGLDLSRVVTFNLDEYYPIAKDDRESYHRFMREKLFDHVNIKPENVHIPDGTLSAEAVNDHCLAYEEAIRKAGGIDLQILGIGRTGHIGFNEPGSTQTSRTRMVSLDPVTRLDAAPSFGGEEKVPRHAITIGVETIMGAKKILIMAFGEHKAPIVARTLQQEPSEEITASFLQCHKNVTFLLDRAAARDVLQVTVGDLLTIPEIADFTSQRAVLRLAGDNVRCIRGKSFEVRLFAFYVPSEPRLRFAEFVRTKGIEGKPLLPYSPLKHVQPLTISAVDDTTLLNVSILPLHE